MKYLTGFILGIIFTILIMNLTSNIEKPFSFFSDNMTEPSDSVDENQIKIMKDRIILDIQNASLGRYAPSGSMLPILNEKSNGIRVPVYSEKDIKIGDIITFKTKEGLIIHRVIEIGKDDKGWYAITKRDNNPVSDGKIRFSQIKYKTIGVLW